VTGHQDDGSGSRWDWLWTVLTVALWVLALALTVWVIRETVLG
jgi:hypothetical protein